MHPRPRVLIGFLVAATFAASCGSPPTTGEDGASPSEPAPTTSGTGGGGGGGSADGAAALEEVYAAVEGLTGEEREAKLLELAMEEDGLSIYSSTNIDDAEPLLDGFADAYDIEPSYYRASSSDVVQRILQEADANYAGNDVVMSNGPEMAILDTEGLLLPLTTPVTDDIVEAGVFDTWAAVYLNTFIAGWNTDNVSEPPGDNWRDFLTNVEGNLAMELGDWDWFATLTTQYFTPELGMTEDEVVELFKQAAAKSRVVDGHTLMAELLVSGEFDAATSLYHHRVAEFISEGAPVAWEPPVRPLVIRPNGVGIMSTTRNPATALLWTEWVLTDGQEVLAEEFRGPASTTVEGGIPAEYEPIIVDLDAITNDRDKWEGLWEEIIAESGSEPISD